MLRLLLLLSLLVLMHRLKLRPLLGRVILLVCTWLSRRLSIGAILRSACVW